MASTCINILILDFVALRVEGILHSGTLVSLLWWEAELFLDISVAQNPMLRSPYSIQLTVGKAKDYFSLQQEIVFHSFHRAYAVLPRMNILFCEEREEKKIKSLN